MRGRHDPQVTMLALMGQSVPYCELFAGRSCCKESSLVGLKGLNCELFGGPSQYEGRIVERYLVSRRVATTHTSPTQIAVRHAAQSKCASDGSRPIPG